ncbi:MAG: DUF2254 domain-containing protein [Candidatus Dormibacteraeota bacterium]|nr:DUF2254 domain-containing protein [Candidatus Dormibacteraeota bacterium]
MHWRFQLAQRLSKSLFLVPAGCVIGAAILAEVSTLADGAFKNSLPAQLASTVQSARALLAATATATLTVAFVTLSVTLLTIQLASSQFSPRALHGFFRDPVTKWVTGLALGTFTYCLFVLRSTRGPLEQGGVEFVPGISVLVALVLAAASVLAVLAFVNHSAHSMQVGEIIQRISAETRGQIEKNCPEPAEPGTTPVVLPQWPSGPGLVVRSLHDGWVQRIQVSGIFDLLPPGGMARLETWAGAFAAAGAPLCTIWSPSVSANVAVGAVRQAIHLGRERTMNEDLAFGLRSLVDISLRALSPGINDPTTARESIVHLSSLLRELLLRQLPAPVIAGPGSRLVVRPHEFSPEDYVDLVFDEIRLAARGQPWVLITLLQEIQALVAHLKMQGLDERLRGLIAQAKLTGEVARASLDVQDDKDRVQRMVDAVVELGLTSVGTPTQEVEENAVVDVRG